MFNIVLVEPEIPMNTGNIARTCAATGSRLHLVEPLGFTIDDRAVKRAGLDYWHLVEVFTYKNLDDFFEKHGDIRCFFASTKAAIKHSDAEYRDGDFLFFGKETKGLDEALLEQNRECCVRIPMVGGARSLNLANSVAVVLYEALRQCGYPELTEQGNL